MSRYNAPFEIHVHGDVPLRHDVTFAQLQEALKPLWKYAGAKSLAGYRLFLDQNSVVTYVESDFTGDFSNSPGGIWHVDDGTWREKP